MEPLYDGHFGTKLFCLQYRGLLFERQLRWTCWDQNSLLSSEVSLIQGVSFKCGSTVLDSFSKSFLETYIDSLYWLPPTQCTICSLSSDLQGWWKKPGDGPAKLSTIPRIMSTQASRGSGGMPPLR